MAIDNFIPELWQSAALTAFFEQSTLIPTLNRNVEGQVGPGNAVNVTFATTPTIVDYAAAGRVISPEDQSDTTVKMLIDQEKAFSQYVDDIDRVQAAGSLDTWAGAAGQALAEDAESYVIARLIAEGTSVATTDVNSGDTAYAAVLGLRTALGKAKVPMSDRYVAVNPEFAAQLLGANSRLSSADTAGTDSELRNGVLGRLLGFTVLETSLLANGGRPAAIAYHGPSVGFADQIRETEALRAQTKFADIVRGLHVYGSKVLRATSVQTHIDAV